jgi:hypothetical protein
MNAKQIPLGIHQNDLESLNSHTLTTHMACATRVLKNTAWRCTRAIRTGRAMAIRLTMSLFATLEMITLYGTCKSFAFAGTHYVNMIANGKHIDCELIADIGSFF